MGATAAGGVERAPDRRAVFGRSRWPDVLGVLWVLVAAAVTMIPALAHGSALGSYDFLSKWGLSTQHGVVVHNSNIGDLADAIIPWTTLAWTQVHAGHLPLWNQYSGLGMPLAFNWQSAAFALPSLIGYLFPLHLAYTVEVLLTLVIAGTGAYCFGRLLGLGALGSAFAATTFELSGPVMGWLGYPHDGVVAWAGWLFAATLLILRSRRRLRSVVLFAVAFAFAVFGGQPEILIELTLSLVVFAVTVLVVRVRRQSGGAPVMRPVVDLVLAFVAGSALAAPLALPGLQLAFVSQHAHQVGNIALPTHELSHFLFQSFDGLPVSTSIWFGYGFYNTTVLYVGVIALVLAISGSVLRRSRPEVLGLAVVVAATVLALFVPLVMKVLNHIPVLSNVAWAWLILPLAFSMSALAGVGLDALVHVRPVTAVVRWVGGGFGALAIVLAGIWLVDRGTLPASLATIRADSFVWPAVLSIVGLAGIALFVLIPSGAESRRRFGVRHAVALAYLTANTAFLISAGAPLMSSSSTSFVATPAEQSLEQTVGSSLVGFGESCFTGPTLGIMYNVNGVFGVREFAVYDPTEPLAYFRSWQHLTHRGRLAGSREWNVFCPKIQSAAVARSYGIGYLLELQGVPGPPGTNFVRTVGSEGLYAVPESGIATLTAVSASRNFVPDDDDGTVLPTSHPSPTLWTIHTNSNRPGLLRLRLTNVPGWNATIDGRTLQLRPFASVMLEARIPAGKHTIEIAYQPRAFTIGIALAVTCVVVLVGTVATRHWRRRRHRETLQGSARPAESPERSPVGASARHSG